MSYKYLIFLVIVSTPILNLSAQTPFKEPNKWILIFNEEFDGLLDNNWKIAHEFDHYGEPQIYLNSDQNVFIRNDANNNYLVLRILKQNYTCNMIELQACNKQEYDYTSGWIETKDSVRIQYGYIEARIKSPKGRGLWPAFWTFKADNILDFTNAAEIDIFEFNGERPKRIATNIHMSYDKNAPNFGKEKRMRDYADDFNIYGLKWTKEEISWYVNNKRIRKMKNPGVVDPVKLILNVALFTGIAEKLTPEFPQEMIIDYVRVFNER